MRELYTMEETLADSNICSHYQQRLMPVAKVEPPSCVEENESETEFILSSMDHLAFSSDDEDWKPLVFCGFADKKVCANKCTKPANGFGYIAHQHHSIPMVDFRGSIADVTTAQQQEKDPTLVIAKTKPNNTPNVSQRQLPLRQSLSDLCRNHRKRLASVHSLDLSVPSHNITSADPAELSNNSEQNISFVSSTPQQSPTHQLPPDNTTALVTAKAKKKRQACIVKRQMPLRKSLSNSDRIYRERLSYVEDTVVSPLNCTEISHDNLYNSESPEVSNPELDKLVKESDLNISTSLSKTPLSTAQQLPLDNTPALLTDRKKSKSSHIMKRQMSLRQSLTDSGQGQLERMTSVEGSTLYSLNLNETSQGLAPNSVTPELSNSELDQLDKESDLNISTILSTAQLLTAPQLPLDNTSVLLTDRKKSKSPHIMERQMPLRQSLTDSGQGQLERMTSVEGSTRSSLNLNETSQGFASNSVTPELNNSELDKFDKESELNISTGLSTTQLPTDQHLPLYYKATMGIVKTKGNKLLGASKRLLPMRQSLSIWGRKHRERLALVKGTSISSLNSSKPAHVIASKSKSTKLIKSCHYNVDVSTTAQQLPLDNTPVLVTAKTNKKLACIVKRQMPLRKSLSDSYRTYRELLSYVKDTDASPLKSTEISYNILYNSEPPEESHSEIPKMSKNSDMNISIGLSKTQLSITQPDLDNTPALLIDRKQSKSSYIMKRQLPLRQSLTDSGQCQLERMTSVEGSTLSSLNLNETSQGLAPNSVTPELSNSELDKLDKESESTSCSTTQLSAAQQLPLDNTPALLTDRKKSKSSHIMKQQMPLRQSLTDSGQGQLERMTSVEGSTLSSLNLNETSQGLAPNSVTPELSNSELDKLDKDSDLNICTILSTTQLLTAQQLPLDNTPALLTATKKSKSSYIKKRQMPSRKSLSDSDRIYRERLTYVEETVTSPLKSGEVSHDNLYNSEPPEVSHSKLPKMSKSSALNISTSLSTTQLSTAQQLPLDNIPALLTDRKKSKSSYIMKRQMPLRQSLTDSGQGHLERMTSVEGSTLSSLNLNETSQGFAPNPVTPELSNSELDKLDKESDLNICTILSTTQLSTPQQLPLDNTPALLTNGKKSKSSNIMKRQMPLRQSLTDSGQGHLERMTSVEGSTLSSLNLNETSQGFASNPVIPELNNSEFDKLDKESDLNISTSLSTTQLLTAQQLPLDNTPALLTNRKKSKSSNIMKRQMPLRQSLTDSGQGQLERMTYVEGSTLSSLNLNETSQGLAPNSVTPKLTNSELDKLVKESDLNISTSCSTTQLSPAKQLPLDNTPALLTDRKKSKPSYIKRQMPLRKSLSDSYRIYRERLSYVEKSIASPLSSRKAPHDILYNSETAEVFHLKLSKKSKSRDLNKSMSASTVQRSTAQQLPLSNTPALLAAKKKSKSLRQSLIDWGQGQRKRLTAVEESAVTSLRLRETSYDAISILESTLATAKTTLNKSLSVSKRQHPMRLSLPDWGRGQREILTFHVGTDVPPLNLSEPSHDATSNLKSAKLSENFDPNISTISLTAHSDGPQLSLDNTPALVTVKTTRNASLGVPKRQLPMRQSLSECSWVRRGRLSLSETELPSLNINEHSSTALNKKSESTITEKTRRMRKHSQTDGSEYKQANTTKLKMFANRERKKFAIKLFNGAKPHLRLDHESKLSVAQRENHLIKDRQLAKRRRDQIVDSGRKKKKTNQQRKKPKPKELERNETKGPGDYIRREFETVAKYWERIRNPMKINEATKKS